MPTKIKLPNATPFTSITKHVHNKIMDYKEAHDRDKSFPLPEMFTHGFNFAEQARRRSKVGRESDASSGNSSDGPPTFFSRIGGAANRTFLGIGQTLRNGFRPDDDASTPWASGDERSSDRSQSIPENSLEMEGRKYEQMLEVEHENAKNSLIQADPYKNVGKDDNSAEEDLLIDEFERVGWLDRACIILHSVTMNWFLLWLMFLRYSVIIFGRISGLFSLKQSGLCIYSHPSLNAIDLTLSIFILVSVAATLIIEIKASGLMEYFYR